MTDLRDAAKMALEALEANQPVNYWVNVYGERCAVFKEDPFKYERNEKAIAALKRALAEDAMDKMAENARELGLDYGCPNCASLMEQNTELDKKLSEWVGLTKEEIEKCKFDSLNGTGWALDVDINLFYKSVEAKLKEKNR